VVQLQLQDEPIFDSTSKPDQPGPIQSGGIIAEIIARSEPQVFQEVDWSTDPYFHHMLAGYQSAMAVPFQAKHLPMTWVMWLRRPPERFEIEDLEQAILRVALIGSLLESQGIGERLTRANERIDRDARQVGELQRSLLPAQLPQISGLELAASYEPSGRAGGDLYDFFPIDQSLSETNPERSHFATALQTGSSGKERWCIIIGDAAGHGLAAAVVMAIVQSVLRSHPPETRGPSDLLVHANRQLCRKNIGGFFTAFLGIYEPACRRLTYAGAGHPYPLLKRASDKAITRLDAASSYPLGIDVRETFEEAVVELHSGDTLLLYTDGITEARNSRREMFDEPRLIGTFADSDAPPARLIASLLGAVRAFAGGHPSDDDQTLVALRAV
jgi:sigma-B regulation protein RsbU (phosphoserine phosphatase)